MIGAFSGVRQYCMVSWVYGGGSFPSARLEQQNSHLTQVEINKMLGLVGYVAAEVPPNDAVPRWVVFLIKLLCETKRFYR